jgi:hypothetical protein
LIVADGGATCILRRMYGKIFREIFDSSIMVHGGDTVYTFIALIVLADPKGHTRITIPALANRIGKPVEVVQTAIEALEADDDYSTTPGHNGRRIIPLREMTDGQENRGWWIVNYEAYRVKQDADMVRQQTRERTRRWREKLKSGDASVTPVTDSDGSLRQGEEEGEGEGKDNTYGEKNSVFSRPRCPKQEILDLYHQLCPLLPRVIKWTARREANLRQRWREHPHIDLWKQYFTIVSKSDFLTGKVKSRDRRSFLADLDWLINATNFAKVMEGRYDNGR